MNTEKIKVYLKILRLRGKIFYMRYIKIFIIALMDIIVDVYDKRRR